MNYRRAEIKDIKRLVELRISFIREQFGELEDQELKRIENQLLDYFSSHLGESFIAYLAETEEEAVGTAFLVINEKPGNPMIITGKTGLILNVFTYKEYRGKGIATELMKELIKESKYLDLSYIELAATKTGEAIYRKLGFKEKTSDCLDMKLEL